MKRTQKHDSHTTGPIKIKAKQTSRLKTSLSSENMEKFRNAVYLYHQCRLWKYFRVLAEEKNL